MMTPQLQQQRPGPGPSQQQQQMRRPPQQQPPQQQQKMQPQNALPPLPPPNKNAGQLYGIPLHPLIMFQTHDNKLNEHDLMINDCFDQLKEIETRLVVVESSGGGGNHPVIKAEPPTSSGAAATDLNELMNDGVFINGIVDNIMTTTNFASIVENIIPLKEENEMLKRRISDQEAKSDQMHMFIQHLEERLKSIENELAQPYEEFPAPAATATEAVAETVVEAAETAETSSVAELVAESINDK
jgi:hypothetical protein